MRQDIKGVVRIGLIKDKHHPNFIRYVKYLNNIYLSNGVAYYINIKYTPKTNHIGFNYSIHKRNCNLESRRRYLKTGKRGGFKRYAGYVKYSNVHEYKSSVHCIDCKRFYSHNICPPRVRQRPKI